MSNIPPSSHLVTLVKSAANHSQEWGHTDQSAEAGLTRGKLDDNLIIHITSFWHNHNNNNDSLGSFYGTFLKVIQ